MLSCSNVVCHSDPMTGELFCPLSGGWVESCPKNKTYEDDENEDADTEDENENEDE